MDDLEDLLWPHGVESLLGNDRLHELALGARRVRQTEDERQRELSLLEIREDRLAEVDFLRRVVEDVVLELKGDPERHSVLREPGAPGLARLAVRFRHEERRDLASAREQKGRLAAHDVEVTLEREVEQSAPLGADDLAFGHAQRHVGKEAQNAQIALFQSDLHGFHVEEIAEEDSQLVSPSAIYAWPAAAQLGIVDDVVVDQRRRVDELDHRGVVHVALALVAEKVRPEQEERGPDSLAAALDEIVADERDRRNPRTRALLEACLHELQLALDRRESRKETPPVLPLFGGKGGDEQAVFQ